MKPNETQPELVWYNGRWFLKSVVDRDKAEREAEKAEAQRVLLANVEGWRALSRAAHALAQAEKGKAPVSGPANPPSGAQAPESDPPSLRSGVASPLKAEAKPAEEERGEAVLSGQIKPNAKEAEQKGGEATPGNAGILAGELVYGGDNSTRDPGPSLPISGQIKDEAKSATKERGEATPGNAGILAGRGGGGDSRGLADGRAEKADGGSGRFPSAVPTGPARTRPPSDPLDSRPPSRPALPGSDQIKANAEEAEQIGGEATSQSGQIKDEAKSQSRASETEEAEQISGEATPGNAGTLAGRGGDGDSRGLESGRAELVYGEITSGRKAAYPEVAASPEWKEPTGRMPAGAGWKPALPFSFSSSELSRTESVFSGQIKANAEEAVQESGEATHFRIRKGKIAGLPEEIREALNERLENGEEGKALLNWLNGLPEVKHYLAAEFEGAPILEQNLSAWRKGGYADWLERNALVEVGLRLQENVAEWKEAGDLDLPQVLGHWLTGQYALATRNMGDLQGHKKWAQLWRIGRGVMRLRQVQEQEEKVKLAEARFAWKQEREAKRAEERAIVRALRAEEKAKRPRRREPTEEETEEAAQECREIFKPETEEDRAYYYKLRRDAEVADALARGEEPPPEPVPIMEQECSTHVTKGRYF